MLETNIWESNIKLGDKDKINVLVSLMSTAKAQASEWQNRAYIASTASWALILGVLKLYLEDTRGARPTSLVFIFAIFLFEILTQFYLRFAKRAYDGNEEVVQKCEVVLRLKDNRAYFSKVAFFFPDKNISSQEGKPKTGAGIKPDDILLLQSAHIIVSVIVVIFMRVFLSTS